MFEGIKTNFKFGITERGDAGLDLTWTDRIHAVEGAIIISKCANLEFSQALLNYREKIIYHSTCTGFGGTLFEPNVPSVDEKFKHLKYIIDQGFPAEQIVVRIDPLFPLMWEEKINRVLNINYFNILNDILLRTESLGIKRVRYSYLDCYPHVLERLKKLNAELVFNIPWTLRHKNEFLLEEMNRNLEYETCCEFECPPWQKVGCISNKDLKILNKNNLRFTGISKQRLECLCPGNKLELLNNKYRCDNKCVYCYWKDKNER